MEPRSSEVVSALPAAGLTLTGPVEHRTVASNTLPGLVTAGRDAEWRLTRHPERLPLSYTLQARKN
ncbi:hypothetical protein [Nocardia niwae]|uniref:hypothetical protein n=1 Tax=Nocardia niwae TaxID=626084 RepID=UPI0033C732D5